MKGNQPARRMLTLRHTKAIKDTVPGPLWPLYMTQANPETAVKALLYGATSSGNGFPQKLHPPQEISVSAHVYNLKTKKPPSWATTNTWIFWSLKHLWGSWQKRGGREQGGWDRSVTLRQPQAHCFYFSSFSNSLRWNLSISRVKRFPLH